MLIELPSVLIILHIFTPQITCLVGEKEVENKIELMSIEKAEPMVPLKKGYAKELFCDKMPGLRIQGIILPHLVHFGLIVKEDGCADRGMEEQTRRINNAFFLFASMQKRMINK